MNPSSRTMHGKLSQGWRKKVVGSRWIYKVKKVVDGSVDKYKASFVAWGFSKVKGIDYEDTFIPVTR